MSKPTGTAPRSTSSADSTPTTYSNQCRAVFQRVHETPRVTRTCARERGHDGPCDDASPKWRQLLASRVLAELPSKGNVTRDGDGNPSSTLDVAARIVAVVVDVVGAADEVLHELSDKLDAERKSNEDIRAGHLTALQHASDLRRELEALRVEHAQLGRDFDELGTQRTLANIELERCRDELQQTRIELDRALERENDDRHEANERKD